VVTSIAGRGHYDPNALRTAWPSGAGRATEVADPGVDRVVRGQVLAEREGAVWPGFDEEVIFELALDRCLLMLTQAAGAFPAGPTIWSAAGRQATAAGGRSDMVT
jgi:hypothetical protein